MKKLLQVLFILVFLLTVSILSASAQCSELYGLLMRGGSNGTGRIFKTDGSENNFQVICDFPPKIDGSYPTGSLCTADNGKFFGVTFSGGTYDCGVIYEWNNVTNKIIKKVEFNGYENGKTPNSFLPEDNGKYIGMTSAGGLYDKGTIFEWDPQNDFIVKKFDLPDSISYYSLIKASNGKYYGYAGNTFSHYLFEWDYSTNAFNKWLISQSNFSEGSSPCGSLIEANNGKLYGITTNMYSDSIVGFIFEWNLANNTFTKKLDLYHTLQGFPYCSLIQADNGKFYGMLGGGYGQVFEWDTLTNICKTKFFSQDLSTTIYGNPGRCDMIKASNGKLYGIYETIANAFDGFSYHLYEFDPVTNLFKIKTDFPDITAYPQHLIENVFSPSCSISINSCNSYRSPSGKYLWTNSGVYKDTVPTSVGCDSVITVNLTIISVDTSVTQVQYVLTANVSTATFQWINCDNEGTPIEGETGQTYTPLATGHYAVVISQNGCVDTSGCFSVIITNLATKTFKQNITLYPNPNDGSFSIDLGKVYPNVEISICEMDGRVLRKDIVFSSGIIDLQLSVVPGMYLVTISSENERAVFKVMKK